MRLFRGGAVSLAWMAVACGPVEGDGRPAENVRHGAERVATVDTAAPSGSVVIAEGATAVATTRVTLTLTATDDDTVDTMCVSSTTSCTTWVPYATSYPWAFTGAGTRAVHVVFRDPAGNVSARVSDDVLVDLVRPANGTATVTGADGALTLAWSGFTDAGSGVAGYRVVTAAGTTTAPSDCDRGTLVYAGEATQITLDGLTNGTNHAYRVCAVDEAGNLGTGVTATGRPAPSYATPSGSIVLHAGATWTRSRTVAIALDASGATDIVSMCIGETTGCTRWEPYASEATVSLGLVQGTHTVRAWFRDAWGNVSASPATDAIQLDTVVPTRGAASASGGDGTVSLSWSGFSDAGSGVASYVVVAAAGTATAPTSCAGRTPLYAGTATSLQHTGLTNGTTYAYRVCAVDVAGNLGTGVTTTGRPAPSYAAPSGSIVLAAGAAWVRSPDVAVTLSASGATDITGVCLSETTTCTRWQDYRPSITMRLRATAGTHTVRAWFRDAWGNVSAAPATDAIGLDRTRPPTHGGVTATAGRGRVALSWSGFADERGGSGIASYVVVMAPGSRAPSACTMGTVVSTGASGTSTVHRSAAPGTYAYRICAIDVAGNLSRGSTALATVTLPNHAPSAPTVRVTPSDAVEGDALACTVTTPSTDADSDTLTYAFAWTVDGSPYTGATRSADGLASHVPADVTLGDETWACTVVPDDGADYGAVATADVVVTALPECRDDLAFVGTTFVSSEREVMATLVEDIDEDGWMDILWVNQLSNSVVIWWGGASGPHAAETRLSAGRSGAGPGVGDVNGDGHRDLVVSNQDYGRLMILLGNGDRTFQAAQSLSQGNFPQWVVVTDADHDGDDDIVVGLAWANCTALRRNDGHGTFGSASCFTSGTRVFRKADLDAHGEDDALVESWTGNVYAWSTASDGYERVGTVPFPGIGTVGQISPYDVNDDGYDDLIVVDESDAARPFTTFLNDGAHGFTACDSAPSSPFTRLGDVGDLDGDGDYDIASSYTCSYCTSEYRVHLQAPPTAGAPTYTP
ncbi:MAG: hypothetical protein RLZZ299_2221 [Pseudomonadota bacterium]|jgi:hypothetical protein